MVPVPDGYTVLLERPLLAHLATSRSDGSVQVNPMWFDWDGERSRFTHTTMRQKFRNVKNQPQVAVSIADPEIIVRAAHFLGIGRGRRTD